jgi:hypothetical protein
MLIEKIMHECLQTLLLEVLPVKLLGGLLVPCSLLHPVTCHICGSNSVGFAVMFCKRVGACNHVWQCITVLFCGQEQHPKQEDVECLCKLLTTVGQQIDANVKSVPKMDAYFGRITRMSVNKNLEARLRFMLQVITGSLFRCGLACALDIKPLLELS